MRVRGAAVIGLLIVSACGWLRAQSGPIEAPLAVRIFREHGLGVDWDKSGSNRIAYDTKGKNGYYDIHISRPDDSSDVCLTCDNPAVPQRHAGAAFWHPSGKYLVFVAEKAQHPGGSFAAIPGFGGFSDVWLMTVDGKRSWQLTNVPSDPDHGVLPAHFSRDGRQVVWSERIRRPNFLSASRTFAWWVIKVADFVDGAGGPKLANVRTLQPGPESFYEAYGFSPDGRRVIFCSSFNQPSVWTQQIFTVDVATGKEVRQLTQSGYNEHATYTPDGRRIAWMSNRDNPNKGTDWWIMNADGSNQRRLTYFNRPGHSHSNGKAVWAGFPSFNARGDRFAGGVQKSLLTQEGRIVIIDMP